MQIWKDIEGYKGHYQISNYGNVRSLKKDAFLMKGGFHSEPGKQTMYRPYRRRPSQ